MFRVFEQQMRSTLLTDLILSASELPLPHLTALVEVVEASRAGGQPLPRKPGETLLGQGGWPHCLVAGCKNGR